MSAGGWARAGAQGARNASTMYALGKRMYQGARRWMRGPPPPGRGYTSRGRGGGGRMQRRQRGYYRKSGYYGRYKGRDAELKFLDINLDDTTIANTWSQLTGSVPTIEQDTTETGRIGRKCTLRQMHWRFLISSTAETAVAPATGGVHVRIVIYWDKQTNGAVAQAGTLFADATDFQSYLSLENKSRFQILGDKNFCLNYVSGAGTGAANVWMIEGASDEWHWRGGIPLEYSGITGAITELRSNNIGIFVIASSTDRLKLTSHMRIRFSDN